MDEHDGDVITELEILADHFGIQVLVTGDLETIDMEVAPWLNNIVVDGQGCFAIPHSIIDTESFDGWAEGLP